MIKAFKIILLSSIIFIYFGCGTSTGSRYEQYAEKEKEIEKTSLPVKEDSIDITPYKTEITIEEAENREPKNNLDIWTGYDESKIDFNSNRKEILKKDIGYRVLILTTDNLEEAQTMRSEIFFKTNQKEVYISFEPPFYKVKAGDFLERSSAANLSFKLNQLGYLEARVISDSVNVFK